VSVHRGVSTVVRVTVKSQGKRVRGRTVHLRGPGFDRVRKTDSKGQASFTVRPKKNGQAAVSTQFCGDDLTISVRAVKHHDE
jgi:hypothetical protein